MKPVIGIVNLGIGNIASVARSLTRLRALPVPINEAREIPELDALILPGVGSFGAAAATLDARGLRQELSTRVAGGTPLLGICLGMQLLLEHSEEAAGARGLGMIPGSVVSLGHLGPRVGWSQTQAQATADRTAPSAWFDAPNAFFYFNHNYFSQPTESGDIRLTTSGDNSVPAMIERDNVTGVQFHPERSQGAGRHFMQRWLLAKVHGDDS